MNAVTIDRLSSPHVTKEIDQKLIKVRGTRAFAIRAPDEFEGNLLHLLTGDCLALTGICGVLAAVAFWFCHAAVRGVLLVTLRTSVQSQVLE